MRRAEHAHERLAERVVQRQPRGADRPAGQHARQRHVVGVRWVAGSPRANSAAARSAAPSETGLAPDAYSASVAWASAFMAVAARSGIGAEAISAGSQTASTGRTRP